MITQNLKILQYILHTNNMVVISYVLELSFNLYTVIIFIKLKTQFQQKIFQFYFKRTFGITCSF